MVKTVRRDPPLGNSIKDIQQDGGSNIRDGPPSSEGDTVGTRSRTIGALDDVQNKVEVRSRAQGGVNLLPIPFEKFFPLTAGNRRTFIPHFRPKGACHSRLIHRAKSRNVARRNPERT